MRAPAETPRQPRRRCAVPCRPAGAHPAAVGETSSHFRTTRHAAPTCSAERGLSNYLLFERARADPKIAQHMVKTDKFADDEHGNLVRLEDGARPTSGGVVIGASGKVGAAAGAPGGGGGERKALEAGGAQPQAPR